MTQPTLIIAQQGTLRRVTPGAFRDRFTSAEAGRIDLAATDDAAAAWPERLAAAELRARMRRLDGAEYVDLDDQDRTRTPVQQLEAAGLLDAAGRAAEILDAPVLDSERPGT